MDMTIIESEVKVTQTGKELKKLTIMVEGKQYPYKNVTAWPDTAPDYESLAVGYKLRASLDEKPSNAINPKSGKPYINRTLVPLKNENGTMANTKTLEDRIAKLEVKVESLLNNKTDTDEIEASDIPF